MIAAPSFAPTFFSTPHLPYAGCRQPPSLNFCAPPPPPSLPTPSRYSGTCTPPPSQIPVPGLRPGGSFTMPQFRNGGMFSKPVGSGYSDVLSSSTSSQVKSSVSVAPVGCGSGPINHVSSNGSASIGSLAVWSARNSGAAANSPLSSRGSPGSCQSFKPSNLVNAPGPVRRRSEPQIGFQPGSGSPRTHSPSLGDVTGSCTKKRISLGTSTATTAISTTVTLQSSLSTGFLTPRSSRSLGTMNLSSPPARGMQKERGPPRGAPYRPSPTRNAPTRKGMSVQAPMIRVNSPTRSSSPPKRILSPQRQPLSPQRQSDTRWSPVVGGASHPRPQSRDRVPVPHHITRAHHNNGVAPNHNTMPARRANQAGLSSKSDTIEKQKDVNGDIKGSTEFRGSTSPRTNDRSISERPNPYLQLLDSETRETVERISKLLDDRDALKKQVVKAFKKVVLEDGPGQEMEMTSFKSRHELELDVPRLDAKHELDLPSLQSFRDEMCADLDVPEEAFGELDVEILRFDFTGSGKLKVNEAYRLVKFHLREYRKHLGGAPITVDIPFKSVEAAGYTIMKKLGAGNQGTAYLAQHANGNSYCIKCCPKDAMNTNGVEELKDEFEAMRLLQCDSIAGAFEMFQDAHNFCMVGDAFYGGDLIKLKERARAQKVVMNDIWWRDVFKQILEALTFMHKQAMIHCDIKEPNIMIKTADFHQPKVVVIDLGVARAMAAPSEGIPHGTPGYVPPETWETKKWFPSGDIFCLGVVIVNLLTDKQPTSAGNEDRRGIFVEGCSTMKEIFQATMKREPPLDLMPPDMPHLKTIAGMCLQKKMSDRPRSEEALKKLRRLFMVSRKSVAAAEDVDRRGSIPLWLHPKNEFATVGITPSFIANMEEEDQEQRAQRQRDKAEAALHAMNSNRIIEDDADDSDESDDDVVVAQASDKRASKMFVDSDEIIDYKRGSLGSFDSIEIEALPSSEAFQAGK